MKRRAIVLLMVMGASLVLASGVAMAAVINGTNKADNLRGTRNADRIDGRGGNDTIRALGGNDKITGGTGNDSLVEASGNDTYRFDDGWGADTLDGIGGGVDTLDFSAVSDTVNVDLAQVGGSNEASSGTSKLNISNTDALIENVSGGAGADIIRGNAANNTLFGNAAQDSLYGREGKDTLQGSTNNDVLEGGLGDDRLNGGEGNDYYRYTTAYWDNDTVTDTAIFDNDPISTYNGLYFDFEISQALSINLVSSSSAPEVYNTGFPSGPNLIEWSNNVIDHITSYGLGNDTIDGNVSPNYISSYNGKDNIFAGVGDDFIDVDDDVGGDTVDCGGIIAADNDTVRYDSGDTVTHCEVRYQDGVLQP